MLADQTNRNQIIDFDGDIFITAGAGTGKSTIIADKIIWLLEQKKINSIQNIAAITFTNKAAAELKWKIEEKLHNRAREISGEKASLFAQSRDLIHESSIGTIHGFCAGILRKYGYLEKIDPVFSIISDDESKAMLRQAFSAYFSHLQNNHSDISTTWKDISRFADYDSLESLLEDVIYVIEKSHRLKNISLESFPVKNLADLKNLESAIFNEHVLRLKKYLAYYDYAAEAAGDPDTLGGKLSILMDILHTEENPLDQIKLRFQEITPGKIRGSKKFFLGETDHENIKEILKEFLHLFSLYPFNEKWKVSENLRELFTGNILPDCFGITNYSLSNEYLRFLFYKGILDFHDYFMEFKRQRSVLAYNDIIYYADQILENSEILIKIQKQYQYIFVDEYQDTDPVQTSIFTKITGNSFADIATGKKIQNNQAGLLKLFRVGDAKQSIYSFRGADLETFYHEKNKFESNHAGHSGSLHVNMRSHPGVINFINNMFLPSDTHLEMDIPHYESLVAGKNTSILDNPGVYVSCFAPSENKKIGYARKIEAQWIVSEIRDLFEKNKNLTICILFLSMKNNLEPYVTELKKFNIPFNLVGRRYYGENFTKKYFIHLLKFLYNPNDQISLTGFLRSPIAGFTDAETELVLNSKYITKFIQNEEISDSGFQSALLQKTKETARFLGKCQILARDQSLTVMLFFLLDNSGFSAFSDLWYNRDILRESMDRFLEIAIATESMNFSTYQEKFSYYIAEIEKLENIPDVDEKAETYSFQNTVQIMSYHKCKGLEFDMVFMADLAYSLNQRHKSLVLETIQDKPEGVMFQYRDDLSYHALNGKDTGNFMLKKRREEMNRLAYVAMTRAKERLYLPVHDPLKNVQCLLNSFSESLNIKFQLEKEKQKEPEVWSKINFNSGIPECIYYLRCNYSISENMDPDPYNETFSSFSTTEKTLPTKHNVLTPLSYSFISGTSILKKISANRQIPRQPIYEKTSELEMLPDDTNSDPLQPTNPLSNAITRGIIAHSVFEMMDLGNPEITENMVKALFFNHAFHPQNQMDLKVYATELMEIYKKSWLFNLIKTGEIIGKEIPFSHLDNHDIEPILRKFNKSLPENNPDKKNILVGYMDLVLKDQNNIIHVIDYKTNVRPDQISPEDFSKHLLETYEIPMALYKKAIENVFPDFMVSISLYHVPTGETFYYENS